MLSVTYIIYSGPTSHVAIRNNNISKKIQAVMNCLTSQTQVNLGTPVFKGVIRDELTKASIPK